MSQSKGEREPILGVKFVGSQVQLPLGCTVLRSVIMDGAIVERPISIRESQILPCACIAASTPVVRQIVTPHVTIDGR